jgi:alkanesulfonate monooxygenase SsuD/methylene tetrahydromethanopterin reductase-like flavin-dependent oxidoreductase (luciferase family)
VLALWASEGAIKREGKYWNMSTEKTVIADIGQGLMLKPFQKPHPPIVVTAVEPFSKGVTEAAARGWDMISANFLLPQWVRSHWPKYVEGCGRINRTPDPARWRVAKTVFVADDERTAREYAFGPQSPYRFYYQQLGFKLKRAGRANLFKPDKEMPDDAVTTDFIVDRLVVAGTVSKVVDELLAFRETTGDFGTLLYCGMDWVDAGLARRSMALMAEKVMPEINRALGSARPTAATGR